MMSIHYFLNDYKKNHEGPITSGTGRPMGDTTLALRARALLRKLRRKTYAS